MASQDTGDEIYGITQEGEARLVDAPDLPYKPVDPVRYRPNLGVIGCGGVSEHHLRAYKAAGYRVVGLCNRTIEKAEKRRRQFFPDAAVYDDYRDLLRRDDIQVLDITPHPGDRIPIVEAALQAGKHVLSQKPFVLDLETGHRLVDLAAERGVLLAVNQNGRWAPHFSYMRQAVNNGLIGEVSTVNFEVHWDHNWVADLPFNDIHHLLLYDFAIHWFDIAVAFFGDRKARKVYAEIRRSATQRARPPLLGHVAVQFEAGQATFTFNGDCRIGHRDRSAVVGSKGVVRSDGPDLLNQAVTLHTSEGIAAPELEGAWFADGMHGAMAELLCAIEANRRPLNHAEDNLQSLALCFAAVASADSGAPRDVGSVTSLPDSTPAA